MPATLNEQGHLKIEEYEFGAFLMEVQKAFEQGFVLDLETNEHYPQKFGNMMEVTLVSTNFKVVDETEVTPEVTPEVEEKVTTEEKPVETTTRKRKNSAT